MVINLEIDNLLSNKNLGCWLKKSYVTFLTNEI